MQQQKKTSRLTLFWAPVLYALMSSGALWAQPAKPTAAADEAASVAKGKRLFMRCAACHDTGDTAAPRIGPHLKGLVGRPMGGVAGYNYSPAMKAKTGVWDETQLNAWLTRPTAVVPGTTMAFIGVPDAGERKALIDFLRSIK